MRVHGKWRNLIRRSRQIWRLHIGTVIKQKLWNISLKRVILVYSKFTSCINRHDRYITSYRGRGSPAFFFLNISLLHLFVTEVSEMVEG